ncbi:MAG: DUF4230 domain-containing protein, partial [Clostridia bacterium]|nr:DUF4230 domain-containing protein [Clostridia bacterium]
MKREGKWLLSLIGKAIVITLVITLVLFSTGPLRNLLRNVKGEIEVQSSILKQKLESSKRLEVTTVDEEGTVEATTSVIIFGKVGSTVIRYRYTASMGIDLSKVIMDTESDRIVFLMPEPEIMNDGIEALEINQHNFFSKAIEKSVEEILNEQRIRCREQYLKETEYNDRNWEDTVKAFQD